jgi:hypothetical protein
MSNTNTQGMSNEQLKALVAKMESDLAAAKEASKVNMSLSIGPKGTVVLRGVASKYGAAYYADTWISIIEMAPKILAFIAANESKLAKKGVPFVPAVKA